MERTPHINATNFHTDNFLGRIWRAWKSFWRTRRSMGSTTSQQAGPQDHISKTWNRPICFRSYIGQICNLCHISGNRSRTGKVAWFFIVCASLAKYLQKIDPTKIRHNWCNFSSFFSADFIIFLPQIIFHQGCTHFWKKYHVLCWNGCRHPQTGSYKTWLLITNY